MKNTFSICEEHDKTFKASKSSYVEMDLKKIKKYYELLVKMQLQSAMEEARNLNAQQNEKTNELEK